MSEPAENTELLFAVDWSSVIPTEIRLFGSGTTETKKGAFLFDDEAASMVMVKFAESGMDRLPFDVAHGMVNPSAPPDSHKALGWFVPEVKSDMETGEGMALYATDIQWTDYGAACLQRREFRFFSPAITFDPDTRRITGLINCALTNLPATKGQRPIVLDGVTDNEKEEDPIMKALLSALGVEDEASAVARVAALDTASKEKDEQIAELSASVSAKEEELIKLNAEIAATKLAAEEARKASKIEALSTAGKLPPAQVEFAKSLSAEQLDAFAETLSAAIAGETVTEPESGKVETLSAEERKDRELIASQLGLSVDDLKESE